MHLGEEKYSDVGEDYEHYEFSKEEDEMDQTEEEEEEEKVQEEEVRVQNEANIVPCITFIQPPPTFIVANQQEEDIGGQPESDIEPPPTCSQSQNEVEEDICPPTCSPPPTCSQPQNKAEEDMGGAKNNSEPPPTCSQLQNKEEQDMVDSKFEDSENEEKYMPCCMNDPTGGWQGFRENCFIDLPTKHMCSDEYESD